MDGRACGGYRPLPSVTADYRPKPQQVERSVTARDRPHQHCCRRAALTRGLHQCIPGEDGVDGERPDAEDVVAAYEQGRPVYRLTPRAQFVSEPAQGVPHLPRPRGPDGWADRRLDAMRRADPIGERHEAGPVGGRPVVRRAGRPGDGRHLDRVDRAALYREETAARTAVFVKRRYEQDSVGQ